MRRLALVAAAVLATAAAAAAATGPASAGTGKCHSSGKKVIAVDRLVIYLKGGVYVGCYTKTGRKTPLVSHPDYDPFAVFAHGTHATVVDGPPLDAPPTGKVVLTIWNLNKGTPFTKHELSDKLRLSFLDSPYGDPITLVSYRQHHERVLDVIYDKGYKRLSKKSVKASSVSLGPGRVARWTEGSRKRSAKL
jgi:hypothetical protein